MPGEARLKVAFVWHMHQPLYRDPRSGEYLLPWVRLHGTKDYYDMVALLDEFPRIRQTFNLVPSLIEQLQDYSERGAQDQHLRLTRKPAGSLSADDKLRILETFFFANPETMIHPYPRYRQLYEKAKLLHGDLETDLGAFSTQDFLDLQVWSNLAWIDPLFRTSKQISRLFSKGEGFKESDKQMLLAFQKEILSSIVPKYKESERRGQIEVSISPYYHPILPLLYDSELAKVAVPEIELPRARFAHPEDLDWQISSAVELYCDTFGHPPLGMWPPEGSVCEEILPHFERRGIRWIASDEEVLFRSLQLGAKGSTQAAPPSRNELFKIYKVGPKGKLGVVFRDHNLSDLISFTYSGWEADRAVSDLLGHLHRIRDSLSPKEVTESLVSIIMDGENAWEYYKNDGHDFLRGLYTELSDDDKLETVTISDAIASLPKRRLKRLFPGSWIGSSFRIWIGHPEDNLAWELLSRARDDLREFERKHPHNKEIIPSCWKEIYAAQGSDWFWWFGEEHPTPNKDRFDLLFRSHLLSVYDKIDKSAPKELLSPVSSSAGVEVFSAPVGPITPKIDGLRTYPEEWSLAGRYNCARVGSAIHRARRICGAVFFGLDRDNLYLRVDPDPGIDRGEFIRKAFRLHFEKPRELSIMLEFPEIRLDSQTETRLLKTGAVWSFLEILELSFCLGDLCFSPQGPFAFRMSVWEKGRQLELWPREGLIEFQRPSQSA